jgi:hypothetical protein
MEFTNKLETLLRNSKKVDVVTITGERTGRENIEFDSAGVYYAGYLNAPNMEAPNPKLAKAFEGFGGEKPNDLRTFIPWSAVAKIIIDNVSEA